MSLRRKLAGSVAVATLAVLALTATALSGAFSATMSPQDAGSSSASAGCGRNPSLTSGMRTIQSGGANRSYALRIPAGYDNSHPYRLVFAFHWVGGTANDVSSGGTDRDLWAYYGLMQLSNNSTIFVAPQGIGNGWGNGGGSDVNFVDDMVRQLEGDLCVDRGQLFSVGFSYGGAMSYALACARPTVFRAVAVYSGGQLSGCDGGNQPIAYLGIHGINDGVLGIGGGREMRDRFVRNNGCTPQSPPEPRGGSLTHTVTDYAGCRPGYPVEWAAFDGGHTPGPIDGGGDGGRTWTKEVVWKFFTQFQSAPQPAPPAPQPSTSSAAPAPPSPAPSTSTPSSPPAPSTPAPTTPAPSAPAPTTSAASGGGNARSSCTATFRRDAAWPGGYLGTVTVSNKGGGELSRWSVRLSVPQGQSLVAVWNGRNTSTRGDVTVANAAYNGRIAASGSQTFGFVVSGQDPAAPTVAGCSSD
ncbi:MAG TPA: cellulose binding domain-containing protein [Kineosporiaceae bacterium]|nr:cellulose binding domain-containing protein [Kineosporiaceae bacterium]